MSLFLGTPNVSQRDYFDRKLWGVSKDTRDRISKDAKTSLGAGIALGLTGNFGALATVAGTFSARVRGYQSKIQAEQINAAVKIKTGMDLNVVNDRVPLTEQMWEAINPSMNASFQKKALKGLNGLVNSYDPQAQYDWWINNAKWL